MIHTMFPVHNVARAVAIWIPGFRIEGTRLFMTSPKAGNTNMYNLKRNHNKMIGNFKVTVRAVSPTEAGVTVMGVDGRTVLTTDFVSSNSEGKLIVCIGDCSRRRIVVDSDCGW